MLGDHRGHAGENGGVVAEDLPGGAIHPEFVFLSVVHKRLVPFWVF